MAVKGDDLIKSCMLCYSNKGLSVRLEAGAGGIYTCPCDKTHKFVIKAGCLKRI
ncbi:MAG: hypothetical protein ABIH99_06135 [Candidatus Micrarchaeota archaeon]